MKNDMNSKNRQLNQDEGAYTTSSQRGHDWWPENTGPAAGEGCQPGLRLFFDLKVVLSLYGSELSPLKSLIMVYQKVVVKL